MKRRLLHVIVALAAAVVAAPADQVTFKTGVTLVRVDVSVTQGPKPVTGLRVDDFELRDNGVLQQIDRVLVESVPLRAFLVLDMSGSVRGRQLDDLKGAAEALLDGLSDTDEAALITFSHQVMLRQPMTADIAAVKRAVQATTSGGSTALNDAVYAAVRLRQPAEDRAVAVVFSDGLDNMSWLTSDEIVEKVKRSDLILYGVTLTRQEVDRLAPQNVMLRAAAEQTGGRLLFADSGGDLKNVFLRALTEIRARYLLTYYPTGVTPGGWHTLDVKVRRGRGDVRARPGYYGAVAPRGPGASGKGFGL